MKELKKMSLVNMQDSLSKEEMKQIMAGSGGGGSRCTDSCKSDSDCSGGGNTCHHCATGPVLTGTCVTSE